MGLQFLDFTQIVAIDTALNLAGFFLVSVSYLRLRFISPQLNRPYKVPGGNIGANMIGGCCVIFSIFAFAIVCWGEWFASITTVVAVLSLYFIAGFSQVTPEDNEELLVSDNEISEDDGKLLLQ